MRSSWVENCSPVTDFLRNKIVMGVIVTLFSVLSLLFICCSCVFCRYRRMKYQYYEKVSLLKNRDGNRNTDEPSREIGENNGRGGKQGKR